MRSGFGTDIRWGVTLGAWTAGVFSLIAAILFATDPTRFDRHGISLAETIAFYFAAGVMGGVVLGAARPLLRRKKTAYLPAVAVGCVVAVSGIAIFQGSPFAWPPSLWLVAILLGAVYGIAGVLMMWPFGE